MNRRRANRRILLFLLLAAVLALLAACRYARIREFQNQLEAFDEHFAFASAGKSLAIDLRDPVLKADDVVHFFAGPSRVRDTTDPAVEKWDYFFYQRDPSSRRITPDEPQFRVTVTLEDGLLTRARASPRFKTLFPPELIEAYGRALGEADVNILTRSLSKGVGDTGASRITSLFPSRERLLDEMGAPTRTKRENGRAKLVYDYAIEVEDGDNMNALAVFVYDKKTIHEAKVLFDYMHFFLKDDTVRVVQVER